MKNFKKLLSLILMLTLVLSMTACASKETPANNSEDNNANVEEAEKNGDIVILFTSDIHCGVDQGFGLAGLYSIRETLEEEGNYTILVDDGDAIQGEPIGTMTNGEAIIDLMNAVGYDIAIPGNHEFDYGMDRFLELTEKAKFPYISCNFNKEGELVFDSYVIKEINGKKIGFVGVTTPHTLTSSTPKYFQDENGNFIYGFMQDNTGEKLYSAVQSAVDAAIAAGAEYIVAMGHMGNVEGDHPYNYADVIANTTGIDAFLDGHSHDTDQVTMKNKDGEDVLRSACGTKMQGIGYARISAEDGSITTGLYTWNNKTTAYELFGIKNDVRTAVDKAIADLEEKLGEVVAKTAVELTIND
ncbi:MAG: bifunctional metallophosphatase/5'-nucleotidase, partial [Lachnospiraceae bacterium]|nr:bifunctional metallophosphatase/5'-nucleotidase [Lachnospiraceae bacterium]